MREAMAWAAFVVLGLLREVVVCALLLHARVTKKRRITCD
jgi:hypothetical protein